MVAAILFTCYRRSDVFSNPEFCEVFLQVLDRERKALAWEVWAYVVMPDHVHVLAWPTVPEYSVSEFLRAIKQPAAVTVLSRMRYAEDPNLSRVWNASSGKHRLWQPGGGHDRNLVGRDKILPVIDYIHNNPVDAKLVTAPGQYRWSSAAFYEGRQEAPSQVDRYVP